MRLYRSLLALFSLAYCCIAFAQSTNASLTGFVDDPTKAVISGAQITAINTQTGVKTSTTTNSSGQYVLPGLIPGTYRIEVDKQGFKGIIEAGLTLHVQDIVQMNFHMAVGSMSETVTVDASGLQINTTDASVSTVIDSQFVENMPLNGRSFQDLLTLAPGVSLVSTSTGYGSGVGTSGDIVVNGQRTESNYFTVDGVSANAGVLTGGGVGAGASGSLPVFTALGTTQGIVPVDDLQEFRSNTSTYSAEYGRSPGGQFSFSTKSGTNILHGSLYDYLRNDALDASNWFNDYYGYPKGRERQNDFGGTLGGPVIVPAVYDGKNKTFFFFAYEGLRLTNPQAATIVWVPETSLRQQVPAALQPLLNSFPIVDDGSDGLNDGFGFYIDSASYPSSLNNPSIRLDHSIGTKLTLFGRYADTSSSSVSNSPYGPPVEAFLQNRTQSATLGATYTLTPRQFNDFRINLTRNSGSNADISTALGGATPFDLGSIPGPNGGPFPQKDSDLYVIFLFGDIAYINLQNYPVTQDAFNITDTHSWTVGRHNIKAGIDWRQLNTTLYSQNPIEVFAYFNESQVLQNTPLIAEAETYASSSISKNQPEYRNFASFVQDEWRVTPRLSLSSGLRWDINPAPTNANGPVPYTVTQVNDLATTALAPQGTPLWRTDWLGFAPRVGIAYQTNPGSIHDTVIRAGFGIFYDTGNSAGSVGYNGIGFYSSARVPSGSFPLTSAQLTLPPPSIAPPYSGFVYAFDPNLRLPYTFQYNLAIEQQLNKHEALTFGYVGSGARKLLTSFDFQPAAIGNANFAPYAYLYLTQGRASSSYNALQVKYQRELYRGLQALASYTWSHSIDDASSNFGIFYLLRARSDFDIRHSIQAAVTYQTPRVKSSLRIAQLLDDWGLDFRILAQTAQPVSIIGSQVVDPNTGAIENYQPNLVPGQPLYLYGHEYPGGRVINYNAFQSAPVGVQGNLPRNYANAFGLVQLNPAIRRGIPIHDHVHLQFRAEAFNIFNHPMFGPIYNYLSNGPTLFGYAYNTLNTVGNLNSLYEPGGPRSLQISLKALF